MRARAARRLSDGLALRGASSEVGARLSGVRRARLGCFTGRIGEDERVGEQGRGGREPLAAIGRREVEERPRQAAADDERLRRGRQRECHARPPAGRPGQSRRPGRVRQAPLQQQVGDHVRVHGTQAHARAAAADGIEQGRLVVHAEHDDRAGGRFLERLEQRVLGVRVEPVGGFDDSDPEATLHR